MTILYYTGLALAGLVVFSFIVYWSARLITAAYYNSKKEYFKNFFAKFKKEMSEL